MSQMGYNKRTTYGKIIHPWRSYILTAIIRYRKFPGYQGAWKINDLLLRVSINEVNHFSGQMRRCNVHRSVYARVAASIAVWTGRPQAVTFQLSPYQRFNTQHGTQRMVVLPLQNWHAIGVLLGTRSVSSALSLAVDYERQGQASIQEGVDDLRGWLPVMLRLTTYSVWAPLTSGAFGEGELGYLAKKRLPHLRFIPLEGMLRLSNSIWPSHGCTGMLNLK